MSDCTYPSCAIERPHYHRDTADGEEVVYNDTRQVVHRIEDDTDRRDVLCTTYQQRNFYTQFRDGFFSRNDSFNYLLHHQVALMVPDGANVLDVCCGRGLMLPLLRYHAKPASYTGLDIKPTNATWQDKRVTDGKPYAEAPGGSREAYYPFPTYFVESNVAEADKALHRPCDCRPGMDGGGVYHDTDCPAYTTPPLYDFIIYTASIEHMHPDDGRRSLHALRNLVSPQARMVLTCPNTPADQDGYDTRYRAHVYEWKLAELRQAVEDAGWEVSDVWGCDANVRDMKAAMENADLGRVWEHLRRHVPQEWLVPALAPLMVQDASEVALLCTAGGQGSLL